MQVFKKIKSRIKDVLVFFKLSWLIRLFYSARLFTIRLFFRKGIKRYIGEIDKIYVCPDCWDSPLPQPWEIGWWKDLVQEIRPQDTIVDIGAYVGLFTIIMAKKTGTKGKVLAFEPNPKSAALLRKNIQLNGISGQVEFFDLALGKDSQPLLLIDEGSISRIIPSAIPGSRDCFAVKSGSLDEIFPNRRIDIIKIDAEGYEASILCGARNLLSRKEGYPRFIWIECHPHLWKTLGASSKDIFTPLKDAGYAIKMPALKENEELDNLNHHWVIFAARTNSLPAQA